MMINKKPLISIIIPAYNRAHLISKTLDSILAQTYQNWECIVVDDGSQDGTENVVKRYCNTDKRFRFYHRPQNHLSGGNGARNFGFEKSTGEYIQWFDSDDLMMPEMLGQKLNEIVRTNCDCVVTRGGELIDEVALTYNLKWELFETETSALEHIKGNLVFGTNGPLFKKSYLNNKKLFDEELRIRQEWEFFSRLLMIGLDFCIVNEVLYLYRNEQDGIRKNISKEKFLCQNKALRKIIVYLNTFRPLDSITEFEARKYFFAISKLNYKRALKNKYYSVLKYIFKNFYLGFKGNFITYGLIKSIKKPKVFFKIFK